MYDKLIEALRKQKQLYARTRREYPEIARQARRNAAAIEKQIKLAQAGKAVR